ncbi:MAG: hypothetical protein JNL67_20750 [Planctomycetaceae bacterium]|nr:hypothetical protein [Planctomycetaceae bacterium]
MNTQSANPLRRWLLTFAIIAAGQLGTVAAWSAQTEQAEQADDTVTIKVLFLALAVSELDKIYARLDGEPLTTLYPDLTQDSPLAAEPQSHMTMSTSAWVNQITRHPVTLGAISERAAFDLVQLAKGNQHSNVMKAPDLKLRWGQDGAVSDVTSREFVTRYEVDPANPNNVVPRKTNVNIGLVLRVNAQRTADGQYKVSGFCERSELTSVTQTVVRTGLARGRELQIPEMAYRVVRFDSQTAPKQELLIDTGFVHTPAAPVPPKPRGFGFFTNTSDKVVKPDWSLFLLISVE